MFEKLLGFKIDPKKINEVVQFVLTTVSDICSNLKEISAAQKKSNELLQENNSLLRELTTKKGAKNG